MAEYTRMQTVCGNGKIYQYPIKCVRSTGKRGPKKKAGRLINEELVGMTEAQMLPILEFIRAYKKMTNPQPEQSHPDNSKVDNSAL